MSKLEVGKDISAEVLKQQFDRVMFVTGARQARVYSVPGRELGGMFQAVYFLKTATQTVLKDGLQAKLQCKGKRVCVLGGGDTGKVVMSTAIRQGVAGESQL